MNKIKEATEEYARISLIVVKALVWSEGWGMLQPWPAQDGDELLHMLTDLWHLLDLM